MARVHIGREILDHQLLDRDERRCGNVDDLAIEGDEVVAIYAGPGAWRDRGRLGRLAGWLGGGQRIRIPWSEVERTDSGVRLRGKAEEYGLGRRDDRLRPYLDRIPGARR